MGIYIKRTVMAKLKITQVQYNAILLHEHASRLKASNELLTESLDPSVELLEEGWGEVVLGVAMMLGVGLTGQNKAMAQDAVKNETTMAQIKSTLEDETKTGELVDALKAKGMKDPSTMLSKNAEKVMDTYNRIADDNHIKYKVDTKVVTNLKDLEKGLKQGYAMKSSDVTTDTIHSQVLNKIEITDTLEVAFDNDKLFVTGGYTLSPNGVNTIKTTIEAIKAQGGKIQSIEVESSTDTERIVKFMNADDPTGNIKLASLRTQSIADLVGSLSTGVDVTHREIPNNGAEVVSTRDFINVSKDQKATAVLREKTSEFRYVNLKIIATFESKDSTNIIPVVSYVKHYRAELVKIITQTGTIHRKINLKIFKLISYGCKKVKIKVGKVDKCAFK